MVYDKLILINHFYEIRKRCWEIIDKQYPEVKDRYDLFRDMINTSLNDNIKVLDAFNYLSKKQSSSHS